MNLNRILAIKNILFSKNVWKCYKAFFQGGTFNSLKEKDNNETEDTNKKEYFESTKIINKNVKEKNV